MNQNSIRVNITAANSAILLLFVSACCHTCAKYFYFHYRLIFGTLYPAYSSYKAVKNKDVREYSRWMMYWITFAIFSFFEVFADIFLSFWLPFYYETKILFVLWLMSPYGNGSKILYMHFIHPQLTSHEPVIDSYIDSAKQMGISWVWQLWKKMTEFANKTLLYFFQITQTVIFYQMQRNTNSSTNGPQIQTQQLLTQSNFLQLFMRSPQPSADQPFDLSPQPVNLFQVDSAPTAQIPISQSQRWFSEEALNVLELNDEFRPSRHSMNLRMRSESESNLDDWEKMDVQDIDGKPPVQPIIKTKKKTKPKSNEKPVRRTARAAALKARAKCKEEESFPEEY